MTIHKGQDWGHDSEPDESLPVIASNADSFRQLQSLIKGGWTPGSSETPRFQLRGGDLFKTIGSPIREHRVGERSVRVYPVDVLIVVAQDQRFAALSHVVGFEGTSSSWFGSPLWKQRTLVAMNASFYGDLVLGPRGHPNDGRIEITDGELPRSERRQGLRRAKSGTHIPHPMLSHSRQRQRDVVSVSGNPLTVFCDGVQVGKFAEFHIEIVPDAIEVLA